MTKETQGGETHNYSYAYDAAGRLTTVTQDNDVIESYHYDGNGNRTDALAGAGGTDYDAQDRLLTYAQYVGGATRNWSFTYTDDGALSSLTDIASGQVTRYTYDQLGNLIKVVLNDSTVIEYIIDGRGRRIGKRRNGALVKAWVYDGQSRIAAELDVATNVIARFVYGTKANIPDYMVKYIVTGASATVGGVYRIVSDHLGSPRMVVDASNPTTTLMEARYSAFGVPTLVNTGTLSAIPFGFAGGLYDADTGLVRFGARDYDPRFGRWTSKDPILFGGGQTNLYVYVGNDPVNRRDPSGLYGTNDCSYYAQRCAENGGSYYCESGPFWCNLFPKPDDPDPNNDSDNEGWSRCTRKCLQQRDREAHPEGGCGEEPNNSGPWNPLNASWEDHVVCYQECFWDNVL